MKSSVLASGALIACLSVAGCVHSQYSERGKTPAPPTPAPVTQKDKDPLSGKQKQYVLKLLDKAIDLSKSCDDPSKEDKTGCP